MVVRHEWRRELRGCNPVGLRRQRGWEESTCWAHSDRVVSELGERERGWRDAVRGELQEQRGREPAGLTERRFREAGRKHSRVRGEQLVYVAIDEGGIPVATGSTWRSTGRFDGAGGAQQLLQREGQRRRQGNDGVPARENKARHLYREGKPDVRPDSGRFGQG